jgi:hypothetical protein
VSFAKGQTRANNIVISLATDGSGTLSARAAVGGGTVHLNPRRHRLLPVTSDAGSARRA